MKKYAIIVAGGTGSRMGGELPKQLQNLNGKPILMHTIEKFANSKSNPIIIVVLNELMNEKWTELCGIHDFNVPHSVVFGGQSRFKSVQNGLKEIQSLEELNINNAYIAIHDAARPLITSALIDKCFDSTKINGATVLAVTSNDSVRKGSSTLNETVDRDLVWLVQTPQTFRGDILEEAFRQKESPSFTDDASVVEKLGYPIYLIQGDHKNIKITYPQDIKIAQLFLP